MGDGTNDRTNRRRLSLTRRELLKLSVTAGAGGLAMLAGPSRRAQSAAPAVAKKVTITYWTPLNHKDPNPRSKAESAMVDLFRKKHPTIEINVQTVPWQVIVQQTIQAAGAGKTPDVVLGSDRGLTALTEARAIAPLDEHLGKIWSKEQKEDWLLPQTHTVIDGKQMGVYWHTLANNLLYVNQALLDAKGLKVPRTWDELTRTGKALTEARTVGFLTGAHKEGGAAVLTVFLIPALWTAGADWLDDKKRVAFNTEAGAKPFQWLYEMVHTHKVIPEGMVSLTRDNVLDSFKAGTAALVILAGNTVSAAGKHMALALAPGLTADKPMPQLATGKFMVVGKDCKEKEAAALFITEQVSPEAQLINAKVAAEPPSRRSVIKDAWFNTPEGADMKFMVDYVLQHGRTMEHHPKHFMLSELVAEATQKIIARQKTIKDALDEAEKRWAAAIG